MSEEELAEAEAMYAQQVRLQWRLCPSATGAKILCYVDSVSYTSTGFMANLSAGG